MDALLSVESWIDTHIIVDTGPSAKRAISVVMAGAYRPVKVFEFTQIEDAARARNFCLEKAREIGADYAVVLDTDERLRCRGDNVRDILTDNPDVDYWTAYDLTYHYSKVRVIKLTDSGQYCGEAHEAYCSSGKSTFFPNLRFEEIPKPKDSYKVYAAKILEQMERAIISEPKSARWWYFKGDCHFVLEDFPNAKMAFEECYELTKWNEEAAWACYRIGVMQLKSGEFGEAIKTACRGLAAHPGIAELNWLSAVAANNAGFPVDAKHFALMAVAQGKFVGFGNDVSRQCCLEPIGLYDGPYEVLVNASKVLGNEEEAENWAVMMEEAKRLRLAEQSA